jgi:hypothetical protein
LLVCSGAIDLNIFSVHFQTEIVSFDVFNLREDIFGSDKDYKRRVFLIYMDAHSQSHYDALVYVGGAFSASSSSSSSEQVLFSTKDDNASIKARECVKSLHDEYARKGECQQQQEWRHKFVKQSAINNANKRKESGGKSTGTKLGEEEAAIGNCTMLNNRTLLKTIALTQSCTHRNGLDQKI